MSGELVTNAADPEQVHRANRTVKSREARAIALDRQQLSTLDGREWVSLLMETCNAFADIHGDAAVVYRELGRRSVALQLLKRFETHCPTECALMLTERLTRVARDSRENAAARVPRATTTT